MSTATLKELVSTATSGDESGALEWILANLDSEHRRSEFLRGLTDRIDAASTTPNPETTGEISRWVGSWLLSCRLERDPAYVAADIEADLLTASGKLGAGVTARELRDRYRRPA